MMNVKKVVKRIAALSAGSLMMGATLMGAMATHADLKDYPSQFVTDGVFNGFMVVGDTATGADTLALTDLSNNLWYAKKSTSTAATVSGDAWKAGTSAKFFELANSNATTMRGENLNQMQTFISKTELIALSSGTYVTKNSQSSYNQYLYFDSTDPQNQITKYVEDDKDVTDVFFFIKSGQQIARYKLEFTSPAESDVEDSTGSLSTTGTYLGDFEDTTITLFGKDYTIVIARRPGSTRENSVRLVLMGGAVKDTLSQGEKKTYTVGGKEYEVELSFVDTTFAKFIVNGESSNKLREGETYKLSDGREIGPSEVLYQGIVGGVQKAEFFLGAGKLELRDDNVENATAGSNAVKSGNEDVDGSNVIITGTDNNATFKITSIEVNMTAEDDFFIGKDKKLSETIKTAAEEKEVLLTENWDMEFKGLTDEDKHDVKLDTNGDRRYKLVFADGDGNTVAAPIAYAVGQYNVTMGEEANEKRLAIIENQTISKNDYFLLTGGSAADGTAKSFVLQYKGSDDTDKSSPKIKFKNVGSSESIDYSVDTAANPRATIQLGGYSFLVNNVSTVSAADDWTINVDLDGGGAVGTATVAAVDSYGGRLTITNYPHNGTANGEGTGLSVATENFMQVALDHPNGNDYDNQVPTTVTLNITATSGPEVRGTQSGLTLVTPEGLSDVQYGYLSTGGKVTFSSPSGNPQLFTYEAPKKQRVAQLFVTSGAVSAGGTAGDLAPVTVPLTATKLASEVSNLAAQNVLVVGGPCANAAAAKLLGNPEDCTEGFEPGKAMVKLLDNGSNVALLVAGYSADDTRAAGKALANYRTEKMSGSEVTVERTGGITQYKVVKAEAKAVSTTTATS